MMEYIQQQAQALVDLTCQMAVIPAPSHHEDRRAAFCLEWMQQNLPGRCHVDEAKNVVCELGDMQKPLVLLMAHTDIVFDEHTPLAVTERDGRLYCPGIGDDTANLAVLLLAAQYISLRLPRDVSFVIAANACEEGLGNLKGCRKLMETYAGRIREVISFDSNLDTIHHDAVGSERYQIAVDVTGGHSYNDFGHDNAIAVMAQIINQLGQIEVPSEGRTTFNFGTIAGGTTVNSIAAHCEMLYEFRSDRADNLDAMRAQMDAVLEDFKQRYAVAVTCIGQRPCARGLDPTRQQQLIDRAVAAYKPIGPVRLSAASTDCNLPLSLGIPSVCLGMITGKGAHTTQEYIEKDSLIKGLQAAICFMQSYD